MKDKIKEIIKTYLDGSDDSYDWTTEELLNLFNVIKCDHQFDRIDAKRIQCIKCEQIESRI